MQSKSNQIILSNNTQNKEINEDTNNELENLGPEYADDFTSYDNLLAIRRQKKLFRKTALENKKFLELNAKPLKLKSGNKLSIY